MKISVFRSLKNTNAVFYKEIDFVFDRIKKGSSKELLSLIRSENDKTRRNELKQNLPCICFSGMFTRRSANAIEAHSGLICLDFDEYHSTEEMLAHRKDLEAQPYTFALFTSPSGKGLKVLVKIPAEVENHKAYFDALKEHYNTPHFDIHCSDVSRVCYESYDPDIYINKDSIVWDKRNEPKKLLVCGNKELRVIDDGIVITALSKWFRNNYSMSEGSRNSNLFKLAMAFNDFGVSKGDAYSNCYQYIEPDFTEGEITRIVDSAYYNKDSFGTKFLEDKVKRKSINELKRTGWTNEKISQDLGISKDAVSYVLDNEAEDSLETFWEVGKKVKVIPHLFRLWLQSKGFYKYYPEGGESYIFVRRENNLIDNTNEFQMKDVTLEYLLEIGKMDVYNHFAEHTKYFKEDFLNLLDNATIEFKKDTIDTSYLYYRNACVEVKKDGFTKIDYIDLDKFVWKKHIINRDFKEAPHDKNDYRKFIWNVSGKDELNYKSIRTTAGYLMHSYKNRASNVSISMSDETISENPNGGTGKGLFMSGISHLKRVAVIDGKTFSFDKSFPYQTVSADTQIIIFDDVKKNFEFERLFSVITEGITLEKKNKDAIKIPVESSPKVCISSNYPIAGEGASFERRKFEIEFKQHYSPRMTPLDEFGKLLFDEWGEDEWASFDNYMIRNIQVFLRNGLVKSDFNNLKNRKLISSTNFDFVEWAMDGNLKTDYRIYKKEIFNQFIEEYPDFRKWLTMRKMSVWIHKYGEHLGFEVTSGRSQDGRWIMIGTGKEVEPEEEPF